MVLSFDIHINIFQLIIVTQLGVRIFLLFLVHNECERIDGNHEMEIENLGVCDNKRDFLRRGFLFANFVFGDTLLWILATMAKN